MELSILLCIDGNYWQHVGVTIASLLRSNPGNTFRIFVVSATEMDQRRLRELRSIVPAGRGTLEAIVYKEAANYQHLPIHDHLTFAAYLRLFMTEYLDPKMQRVIYLDSDLVVCGDLSGLWQIDLEGAYVGAAPEPYDEPQRTPFSFGPKDLYVNSGVMVVDLGKWRADNILTRFIEFANANQKLLIYSLDQDILNSVCRGKIHNIGYEWNWQALCPRFAPEELGLTAAKFAELRRAPRIVHYTGPYKPWYYRWEPHYKNLYYESLAQTPWAGSVPPDKTLGNLPGKVSKMFQRQLEWYFPSLARMLRSLRK